MRCSGPLSDLSFFILSLYPALAVTENVCTGLCHSVHDWEEHMKVKEYGIKLVRYAACDGGARNRLFFAGRCIKMNQRRQTDGK